MSRDGLPATVAANKDISSPFLPRPILTIADAFDCAPTSHDGGVTDEVYFVIILSERGKLT